MGNNMKTIRNSMAEIYYKKSTGNQTIGKTMNCPNCQRIFGPKTTNHTLNSHLDQCLNNVNQVQQQQQEQNVFNLQNPLQQSEYKSLGYNYYWVKKSTDDNQTKWERIPTDSINGAALQKMSIEEIKERSFPEKQLWLRVQLEKLRIPWQMGSDSLKIDKNNVLNSTLNNIWNCNMHKEVKIEFLNDKVLDAGGLLREWLVLVFKELTHPSLGVFVLGETEDVCYKFNPEINLDEYLIDCFRIAGVATGKAIFERMPLNIVYDRTIIKHIIGKTVEFEDINYFDKWLYKSLDYLKKNEFDPEQLQQYFVFCRGSNFHELKENGCNILVTNENKQEFIDLNINYLTYEAIKQPLNIFLNEINKIVPRNLLSIFDANELEMIIFGLPFIDINEWKEQTCYQAPYDQNHKVIRWFWKILGEMDQEYLSKFLQYCTGSSRIPVNGFSKLESNRGAYAKFKIVQTKYINEQSFPIAHTCFNRLELPNYPSEDVLKKFIKAIVLNDLEGVFGLE